VLNYTGHEKHFCHECCLFSKKFIPCNRFYLQNETDLQNMVMVAFLLEKVRSLMVM